MAKVSFQLVMPEREVLATEAEKAAAQRDLAVAKDLRRAQAYYASR